MSAALVFALLLAANASDVFIASEDVNWARTPTEEEMASFFPHINAWTGEASVELVCVVGPDGMLNGCEVVAAAPDNLAFARATLNVAKRFRMQPTTRSGRPSAGLKVRLPIRWQAPD
ncbi:energy transducer TonB [Caulobacter mirabilis]|uniref:TonB C-terminal domain-containing protein n=1 Tax=Caulobacter mirabilis TaxID=69666 RepID=A0A2D2AXL5_9CAUL|nr:energy transducer TonB [Caulobacter mirabilis]ATQ42759.1 hypothetical protein CSW64_10220 [Caulobacter mirabilis]